LKRRKPVLEFTIGACCIGIRAVETGDRIDDITGIEAP
jgi:hypothetical protein